MERTDFSHIAMVRRRNWTYLHSLIREVNPKYVRPLYKEILDGEVPLGYPVIVAQEFRNQLRTYLKEQRVFCAVHWPLGAGQEASGWAEDVWLSHSLLTLPIDQRMTTNSLDYIVHCIRQFDTKR
jgi:dTDP-4-amino-4,6-dideoxygalactose transaminase